MASNEFLVQGTAYGRFTLPNSSATSNISTSSWVPAGAIITGIRMVAHSAITATDAAGTVVPRVGTVNIAATVNVSDLPAVSTPGTTALATTAGIYSPGGFLNLQCGTSNTSSITATYDYFVDYIYVDKS